MQWGSKVKGSSVLQNISKGVSRVFNIKNYVLRSSLAPRLLFLLSHNSQVQSIWGKCLNALEELNCFACELACFALGLTHSCALT